MKERSRRILGQSGSGTFYKDQKTGWSVLSGNIKSRRSIGNRVSIIIVGDVNLEQALSQKETLWSLAPAEAMYMQDFRNI